MDHDASSYLPVKGDIDQGTKGVGLQNMFMFLMIIIIQITKYV